MSKERPMTEEEKRTLIALFRAEIRLYQALEPIKHEIALFCHSRGLKLEDLEECERVAQEKELD